MIKHKEIYGKPTQLSSEKEWDIYLFLSTIFVGGI